MLLDPVPVDGMAGGERKTDKDEKIAPIHHKLRQFCRPPPTDICLVRLEDQASWRVTHALVSAHTSPLTYLVGFSFTTYTNPHLNHDNMLL